MIFTEAEVAYLRTQQTGRIATVSPAGQPDVAPVGFSFDGEAFAIHGIDLQRSLKYRNVLPILTRRTASFSNNSSTKYRVHTLVSGDTLQSSRSLIPLCPEEAMISHSCRRRSAESGGGAMKGNKP